MSSESNISVGLAGRYSSALFELAETGNCLEKVASDLETISNVLNSSGELQLLMRSPVISMKDQKIIMMELLKKLKISDLTSKFVGVVANNRRLIVLPKMIHDFQSRLSNRQGIIVAEVFSPKELSKNQVKSIGDALKSVTGKKVTVQGEVDEGILGGLIVKIGSKMVDNSMRTKLNRLQVAMKGNV